MFNKLLKSKRHAGSEAGTTDNLPPISDNDFEFLFQQLIEGIAHGWQGERLVVFFKNLGPRGASSHWLGWIDRYEAQLANGQPDLILGSRTIFLGEQLRPKLATRKLGERFFEMGQRIANPNAHLAKLDLVWEYDGPDAGKSGVTLPSTSEQPTPPTTNPIPPDDPWLTDQTDQNDGANAGDSGPKVSPPAAPPDTSMEEVTDNTPTPPEEDKAPSQVEQLTLEQLQDRLEADPNFREQIAAQVGVSSTADTESIIQALTKGVNPAALDQDNYKHWFYFGVEKADQGKLEEAIAAWDKCLAIKPDLSSAWHNRGSALGQLNRLDEAISSFERAIEYNSQDFQAWNDKGIAVFRQQKLEEAIYCWDKTVELKPDFYQAWFNKGCLYENQGKYEQAKECYDQTLAIEPNFELALTRKQRLENPTGSSS